MFKAYSLGRPFGVELKVHSSLLWLLGLVLVINLVAAGPLAALGLLVVVGMLAVSVTLHELGHIGAARLFGIGTTGITLYPIGGVARLTREARTPTEEVVVALAGPAVNVLLAGLAAVPLILLGPVDLALLFLQVNAVLAVFNLIPAFPMDGGRVLRGVLWRWLGRNRATRAAARAGQGFAILFGLAGLVWSPMLVFIAIFVFLQASAELARLRHQEAYGYAAFEPLPPGVVRPQVLGRDGRPVQRGGWGSGPAHRAWQAGPPESTWGRSEQQQQQQVRGVRAVDIEELLRRARRPTRW